MKLLFLGPGSENLMSFFRDQEISFEQTEERLNEEWLVKQGYDAIISYGYRYIISPFIINQFRNRIFNLHISYLPWNRGADPNLWSFLEDTPKGVTIHYMDEGVDTGDILLQKNVSFDIEKHTLRTSYNVLKSTIEQLFTDNWKELIGSQLAAFSQKGSGSYHKKNDKNKYLHLMTSGWDTPVKFIHRKALSG